MKKISSKGFTLLEVMLSIGLLSIIIAVISGSIHFGQRVWEVDKTSDNFDEINNTVATLKLIFEKAYPVIIDISNQQSTPAPVQFQGTNNECKLIVLSEGAAQWGGLIVFDITTEPSADGLNLLAKTAVFRNKDGLSVDKNDPHKSVILNNIMFVNFSYYGVTQRGGLALWHDDWVNLLGLPKLIKINVGIRRQGRLITASTIVAVKQST